MLTKSSISVHGPIRPRTFVQVGDVSVPGMFSVAAEEYAAARGGVAVLDRADRAIAVLTGRDRKAWLHNLVTNDVKKLEAGNGCYAFAIDLRGRILFDLDVLDVGDALWLLTDAVSRSVLRTHLERYHITEDVALQDTSAEWACIGVCGPCADAVMTALAGAGSLPSAELSHGTLSGSCARLVRRAFAGAPAGFELWSPVSEAAAWWSRLIGEHGAVPIGHEVLDVLRIEAGIPWMHRDLDDRVVAPETGQAQRAISYHKGCYLGQEVIERMRSHGVQARRLVRVRVCDGEEIPLPAVLRNAAGECGRVTSLVRHPVESCWIGLGYLKAQVRDAAGLVIGAPPRAVTFTEVSQ